MSIELRRAEIWRKLNDPEVGHPVALAVNPRITAFVVQFARRFGGDKFPLKSIYKIPFDPRIAEAYGLARLGPDVKLPRQDDLTVLSKHLPPLGLLEHLEESSFFRLTERGMELAENEELGARAP